MDIKKDLLTFEKIGKALTGNGDTGYWLVGIILIVVWSSSGFIGILLNGKWLHTTPLVYLSTIILFLGTLIGLRYLREIYYHTINRLISQPEEQKRLTLYNLLNRKTWWILFVLLLLNQTWWFWNEYSYLLSHPEVIGTLPYRGANLGAPLLAYEAIVSTFLFIIFVDLVTMIIGIFKFPSKIKKLIKIDIFAEDKCGGLSDIGRMMLSFAKVYFILLALGTFGRYPGVTDYPLSVQYFWTITGAAWILGVLIFFLPQYIIRSRIKGLKKEELQKTNKELKGLIKSNESFHKDHKISISILALFRTKDEIENLKEFPYDFTILKDFILSALLPIFTNIISVVIS